MGCHILFDVDKDQACFFDSTVGVAFGPVMGGTDNYSAEEMAEWFMKWVETDPRSFTLEQLHTKWSQFYAEVEDRDETLTEDEAVRSIVFGHFAFEQPYNLDAAQVMANEACYRALYRYYLPDMPVNVTDKRGWIEGKLRDLWEEN